MNPVRRGSPVNLVNLANPAPQETSRTALHLPAGMFRPDKKPRLHARRMRPSPNTGPRHPPIPLATVASANPNSLPRELNSQTVPPENANQFGRPLNLCHPPKSNAPPRNPAAPIPKPQKSSRGTNAMANHQTGLD